MRRGFLSLCIACVFSSALAADGGSAYSIFGIGDISYFPNSRSAGMGYTGIGLPGANYINVMSPGTWARINRTRIEANFLYEGFKSREAGRSLFRAKGTFNGAALAVPISEPNGIVFTGGFVPYSRVNYNTIVKSSFDGVNYTVTDHGSGGVDKGQVGLSFAPFSDLELGASLNYLFGTITNSRTLVPDSVGYAGARIDRDLTLKGLVVSLGGVFTGFGRLSEPLQRLSLGFVVTSRGALTADRQAIYYYQSELDSSAVERGKLVIPISYGVGIAYQASERFLFAADYFAQPWRNSELVGSPLTSIRNSSHFGIGGERIPNKDISAPWLERIGYRLGFFYDATYYRVNGTGINAWGITGGLALPLSGETRLNVAAEYGSRGTTANGLIKDTIFRLALSLNISEQWFIKYEEE